MLTLSDILSSPLEYYSSVELSRALGVAETTMGRWLSIGKIQSKKVGDVRLVKGEWVNDYLKSINDKEGFKHISKILSTYKLPNERQ